MKKEAVKIKNRRSKQFSKFILPQNKFSKICYFHLMKSKIWGGGAPPSYWTSTKVPLKIIKKIQDRCWSPCTGCTSCC